MIGGVKHIANRLFTDTRSRWSMRVLILFVFVAVFGDFIANEKPLYCKLEGKHYFPLFRSVCVNAHLCDWNEVFVMADWHAYPYEKVAFTLIPYSSSTLDPANGNFRSPFDEQNVKSIWFRHWMGTDALGRDVTAGMIRGCRIALLVGLLSMLIALLIGIPIGARAGYYGDTRLKSALGAVVLLGIAAVMFCWNAVQAGVMIIQYQMIGSGVIYILIGTVGSFILWLGAKWLNARSTEKSRIHVPWDFMTMRSIEVLRSIPAFFLLFAVLGIIEQPSIIYVILLIALLRTPTIIRYVRAETLKLRDKTFIDSARVIGLSDNQIIRKHIIPNAMGPVLITVAFGIGGAVLLESGLSFLGIGLSIDQISWGKLLSSARSNFSAWWLAIIPGTAIFITVAIFNQIGEVLSSYFESD